MSPLHAVIMAGGAGTRFWPKSRTTAPKQLLALRSERSLLGETVDRLAGRIPRERIWVITGEDQHAATIAALPDLPPANIVAEPARRDTAACIGLAAALVRHRDPEAVLAVLPADHIIEPAERFCATLDVAAALAQAGPLVTLGIPPAFPATGYGYIERGDVWPDTPRAHTVRRFVEKPDLPRATEFVAHGGYYWNSGIFVFTAARILEELTRHLPAHAERLARISAALGTPSADAVIGEEFPQMEKISVDYGVFERAEQLAVVEADFDWDDVGAWSALERHLAADAATGGVSKGTVVGIDSPGSIVWSDEPGHLVGVIGVPDLVVVHTADATLVCPKDQAERVKQLVARCRERGLDRWLD